MAHAAADTARSARTRARPTRACQETVEIAAATTAANVTRMRPEWPGVPGVGDHTAVTTLTRHVRGLPRAVTLGCLAAVAGWLVVGLLPWWQVRSDYVDATGSGTHV